MDMRTTRSASAAAGALLVLAALAGCSSSGGSTASSTAGSAASSAASSSASATAAGGGQASGTVVTVSETEFALHLSQTSFSPGTYTFMVDDHGQVAHALAISGPGVQTTQTKVLSPGDTAQLTVALQAGSYELWCPVDGHKGLGMDTHIQVG